jgi:diacylglycerol kinase (ATP)
LLPQIGLKAPLMKSPHTGLTRILAAFTYSYHGFKAAWRSEAAFRQDSAVFVVGTIVALCLPVGMLGKGLLVSALVLILLMELVNTSIEAIVDRISEDYHELSKKAKDIGSLLVLLSFINAGVVWLAVLIWRFSKGNGL